MSVSTPILTTSSEICWACTAPPDAATTRPAASAVANDFMVSSPWPLVGTLVGRTVLATFGGGGKRMQGCKKAGSFLPLPALCGERPEIRGSEFRVRGEAYYALRTSAFVDRAPHPSPLPAKKSGERGRRGGGT